MKRGRLSLVSLLSLLAALGLPGCGSPAAPSTPSLLRPLPSPGAPVKNYLSPNGNPAQSGRVDVLPRPLSRVRAHAPLDPPRGASGRPLPPAWVLVDGQGRAAIGYGDGQPFDLVDRDGRARRAPATVYGGGFLLAPPGVWTMRAEVPWAGEATSEQPPFPGEMLAAAVPPSAFEGVFRVAPRGAGPDAPGATPYRLEAWAFRREPRGSWSVAWHDAIEGIGAGAIDARGRAAMATDTGRLVITGPEIEEGDRPRRHVDVKVGVPTYFMCAVEGGYILLEPRRAWREARFEGGRFEDLTATLLALQTEARARVALFLDPPSSSLDWKTGVVFVDAEGAVQWRAEASFRALSPPLDLGGGRVALVGDGIGVLDKGTWTWALPAERRLFATAFADGTLAVAWGNTLSLVTPGGQRSAELRLPGEQLISAPPAIAEDGSVWVAGPGGLFVLE